MKRLCLVLGCLLVAAVMSLWLGCRRGMQDPVSIRILSRVLDSSDNYRVTFDVTNSCERAFTILCFSLGERIGPRSLPAYSASRYTLLDEGFAGRVNGPVQVQYTPAHGSLKERADSLLSEGLRVPFRLIKWKIVATPDEAVPNPGLHWTAR